MANNNALAAQKPKFSMVIKSDTYQKLIQQTLGNPKKAERYTAAIMSAVATNPQLQTCEAKTILSGSCRFGLSCEIPGNSRNNRYTVKATSECNMLILRRCRQRHSD